MPFTDRTWNRPVPRTPGSRSHLGDGPAADPGHDGTAGSRSHLGDGPAGDSGHDGTAGSRSHLGDGPAGDSGHARGGRPPGGDGGAGAPGRPAPAGSWFPGTEPGPPDGLPLISFPYAGGTPSAFHDWARHLGTRVRVVPVLLPGRGLRLREESYTVLEPLARDVADALQEHRLLTDGYAFFGHSMGALLAYEVACELRRRGEPEPLHLFVSGSRAPHLYGDRADHLLDDDQLRAVVRDLGGLGPDENVGSAYLDRRLPALRADLRVCELYRWPPRAPLEAPVTAVSATDDPVATEEQVDAWRICTAGPFTRLHLPGNHFFLNGPSRFRLLRELRRTCEHLRTQTSQRNAS